MRVRVFERDGFCCQYCEATGDAARLTIDHLVPLDLGGLDEITNYVTACESCNQRKANLPLNEFAKTIKIAVDELPVHGDAVIDNEDLPLEIRELRKRIFDRTRKENPLTGPNAQKKLEKAYRRDLWQTNLGKALEGQYPNLPGHVRVMIPEIGTIANDEREAVLLVELAKSAKTRNLIGTLLTRESDIEARLDSLLERSRDRALTKRVLQARERATKAWREMGP